MFKNIFNIEILRTITHSWGRFIAIFAIVALGVGFYAGLRMTAPDMRLAADAFYDATNLMDIRVVSTMGLDESDIDEIASIDGVEDVVAGYETDVVAELDGEPYVMRVHSLPYDADGSDALAEATIELLEETSINQLILEEGRWPVNNDECVLSVDRIMNEPLNLGDTLKVTESIGNLDDTLKERQYKVVGLAHSSYYAASASMGSTTLGSGLIQQFMYVPQSDFASDYPITEAFITVEGAKTLNSSSAQYDELVQNVMDEIAKIADSRQFSRLATIKADAQKELDEARQDFEQQRADAYAQLDEALAKLNDAEAQIRSSEEKLEAGQREYQTGLSELEDKESQGKKQIDAAQAEIDSNRTTLDSEKEKLDSAKIQLDQGWAALAPYGINLDNADAKLAEFKELLANTSPSDPNYQTYQFVVANLESLITSQQEYEGGLLQYQQGLSALEAAQGELNTQRQDAERQISSARSQLAQAKREIDQGRTQLASGKAEYESGLEEYAQNRDSAVAELADAETQLDEAQQKINDIETPEWLIMDRSKNYGAESFDMDAGRVDNIAMVFPFVFFLVAALVALTTMTRMVDEERMQIGTFKALGYSRSRITSKYLIYAGIASTTGSILGIAVLAMSLPAIIMSAYSIMYIVPVSNLAIDWPIAITATLLGVGITLLATAAAAISTLRESPASLMLPKAPKAGKRILLERVKPLWSHLSFLWKVTCRNIFRYKKRLFMTVVGIAGCTALLLTGFGLHDSINDIIDKHYGQIVKYNMVITTDDDIGQESLDEINAVLEDRGKVRSSAEAFEESMVAVGDAGDLSVELIVPRNFDSFSDVWVFRDRVSGASVEPSDTGALITEKIATRYSLQVGDTLSLATQDDMGNATNEIYDIPVEGIIENYIAHDVFMSANFYEKTFHKDPHFNNQFVDTSASDDERDEIASSIRDIDGVRTVAFNDEVIDTYRSALNSVNMVVIVLIIAAALLAFIVLYNLTNINITERMREIATLKVLGFTSKEIYQYIFREILILSVLGALVGLVLGVFLENFVVVTAEVDAVMFGRQIHLPSFVYSFALTMVFTVIVTLSMRAKLTRIDMVESLKSNE